MPAKCCIPICKLEKDSPGCSNLSFYRIPAEQKTREKWIQILTNTFNIECKCGLNKYRKIRKGSIPTIFHDLEDDELYDDIQPIGENDEENIEFKDELIDVCAENEIPKQSKVDQLNISNAEGEFNIKIEEHLESNEYVHEERQSQVDQLNISNTEGEFNIKIEEHLENNEYVHEERQTSGIPVVPFYKTLANLDLEALNLHIIHQKVLQT